MTLFALLLIGVVTNVVSFQQGNSISYSFRSQFDSLKSVLGHNFSFPNVVGTSKLSNPLQEMTTRAGNNFNRLAHGIRTLVPTFLETRRLKKLRRTSGDTALTFTDYMYIKDTDGDLPNPWAWRAYPSTFNNISSELLARQNVLIGRRRNTLLSAILTADKMRVERRGLLWHTTGDSDAAPPLASANDPFNLLAQDFQRAASQCDKRLNTSLSMLTPWLTSDRRSANSLALNTRHIPAALLADCCACMGQEHYPAYLPVVNKWNSKYISQYIDKISEGDQFMRQLGVASMTDDEVGRACHERFISPIKPGSHLRQRLQEWLDLALGPTSDAQLPSGKLINCKTRRLALLGLEVARDFREASDLSAQLQALVARDPDALRLALKEKCSALV